MEKKCPWCSSVIFISIRKAMHGWGVCPECSLPFDTEVKDGEIEVVQAKWLTD